MVPKPWAIVLIQSRLSFLFIKWTNRCHIMASKTVFKHIEPISNRTLTFPLQLLQCNSLLPFLLLWKLNLCFHTWSDSGFPDNVLPKQHPEPALHIQFCSVFIKSKTNTLSVSVKLAGWDLPLWNFPIPLFPLGKGSCCLLYFSICEKQWPTILSKTWTVWGSPTFYDLIGMEAL